MLIEALAAPAATALENARLYQDLQGRLEELDRSQAQLVRAARLAAVGELAAGVAHELNNPLTAVLGFAELLLERAGTNGADRGRLEAILRRASQARDIVAKLLSFSQQMARYRRPLDLNQVVRESLSLIRLRLEARGVTVVEQYALDLPILLLDERCMTQVVFNLANNALEAMPDGGTLTISTERQGQDAILRLADTGTGIAPEHLPRIFEPFFTTRPVGEGAGLGLAVSLGCVQDHGGWIEVESQLGQGSTFTVWLPLEAQSGAEPPPSAPIDAN
jgi:signal transduction histidine kinase